MMQAQFLDLYRASIRSAADLMKLSLEQTERLQQQQLQLIRGALEENTRSSGQLGEVKSLDDVIALNSRLAGAQLERMAEFWSSWWRAAGDTQKSMIDQMQSQMGQAKERVRESYQFTARTSEDAARLAAAQVSSASPPQERKSQEHRKSA
jgi:hypothetical protein